MTNSKKKNGIVKRQITRRRGISAALQSLRKGEALWSAARNVVERRFGIYS
jgi:hypothetical protein